MSRGEEKAAVNVEVLRAALRGRLAKRFAGRSNPPEEGTTAWFEAAGVVSDVGTSTLKKLLRGEPVTASILTTVLNRLHLSAIDLVSLDDQCRIPSDPAAYSRFRHGYFIADLRPARAAATAVVPRAGRPPGGRGPALGGERTDAERPVYQRVRHDLRGPRRVGRPIPLDADGSRNRGRPRQSPATTPSREPSRPSSTSVTR